MLCFEACPRCCQIHRLEPDLLEPMVLSGDNKEMRCDVCDNSFKLPDCDAIIETARQQRDGTYGHYQCGCGELVPNGECCIDCDLLRDILEQ